MALKVDRVGWYEDRGGRLARIDAVDRGSRIWPIQGYDSDDDLSHWRTDGSWAAEEGEEDSLDLIAYVGPLEHRYIKGCSGWINATAEDSHDETTDAPNAGTVYIAGPMRGYPKFNFPAFDAARDAWLAKGWKVISPADLDREIDGFDPESPTQEVQPMAYYMRRDIEALLECTAVAFLPGWRKSQGATLEHTVAVALGLELFDADTFGPLQEEDVLDEASRITRGDRQASYGPPDQDFRRTAGMWTALLSHKLLPGAVFEPAEVAAFMICLKMSRQVHQKKRDNWTDTAGYARCGAICDAAKKLSVS